MSRSAAILSLLLWFLVTLAGSAFACVRLGAEKGIWGFSANPATPTREIGSQAAEVHWGSTPRGDECATDVGVYVNQNPWSKFDSLGLQENKEKEKQEPLTKFAKPTARDRRELKAGDVFGFDSEESEGNKGLYRNIDVANGVDPSESARRINEDLADVAEKLGKSFDATANVVDATVTVTTMGAGVGVVAVRREVGEKLRDFLESLGRKFWGRKGKPSTRQQNQDLIDFARGTKGEGEHVSGATLPERGVRDPTTGKIFYPDGQTKSPGGTNTFIDTYDSNALGGMTADEAAKAVGVIKGMPPGSIFISAPKIE